LYGELAGTTKTKGASATTASGTIICSGLAGQVWADAAPVAARAVKQSRARHLCSVFMSTAGGLSGTYAIIIPP